MHVLLMISLLAGEYEVSVYANQERILKGDPLLVKAVIHNGTRFGATIEKKDPLEWRRIHWEIRKGGEWHAIPERKKGFVARRDVSRAPLLEPDRSYCEYATLMAYDGGEFIFDEVGTVEVRATAVVQGTDIKSLPIRVLVEERPDFQLKIMTNAVKDVGALHHFDRLGALTEKFKQLEEAGGNAAAIGRSHLAFNSLTQSDEESCEARIKRIRDTMDSISADCAILGLARKYAKARDYESLGLVVKEIKEDQTETIAWKAVLEFESLRRLPSPRLIIPREE